MVESYQIKINKCLVDPAEDEIKVYSQGGLDAFNLYFRRVNGVIYVYGGGNEQGLITPGAPVKVGDNPFNVDVNTYLPIFSQNDHKQVGELLITSGLAKEVRIQLTQSMTSKFIYVNGFYMERD